MKTVSILFADDDLAYALEKSFANKSAFERALEWAQNISEKTVVFSVPHNSQILQKTISEFSASPNNISLVEKSFWNTKILFSEIARICGEDNSTAVYAFADCPFLSATLAKELLEVHKNYSAEYTFADGYPSGLAPEILDGGVAHLLSSLCDSNLKSVAEKKVCRTSIWDALKVDINSFEIETVLAPEDFRLYRLAFDCSSRRRFFACKSLFEKICDAEKSSGEEKNISPLEISRLAVSNEKVLKTLPAFYNVAISEMVFTNATYLPYFDFYQKANGGKSPLASEKNCFMDTEKFSSIVKQISDFSEKATVSLSAWGEPLLHPDFCDCVKTVLSYPKLSVLIETDGNLITEDLCQKIKSIVGEETERIIWIVTLDAFTEETYQNLRAAQTGKGEASLAKASNSVAVLSKYFPNNVYPQMTRLNENENELEQFYRFWSDSSSASGGKVIIQKYDSYCGVLPDRKPADLSPVGRNPCWHLRRDMTILCNGDVPLCHEFYSTNIMGNVFSESIQSIWEKISLTEIEECKNCDEYYTYNF